MQSQRLNYCLIKAYSSRFDFTLQACFSRLVDVRLSQLALNNLSDMITCGYCQFFSWFSCQHIRF